MGNAPASDRTTENTGADAAAFEPESRITPDAPPRPASDLSDGDAEESVNETTIATEDNPIDRADADQPVLWLSSRDRLFVGALAAVALLLMSAHWLRLSGWGLQEIEIERQPARQFAYRIDINTATWVEWSQLDGIGEKLARRIVDDRDANGPFTDIDDIQRVKGIGPKKVDAIRPWLRVGSAGEPAAEN